MAFSLGSVHVAWIGSYFHGFLYPSKSPIGFLSQGLDVLPIQRVILGGRVFCDSRLIVLTERTHSLASGKLLVPVSEDGHSSSD